jgi:hypothetical protein
VGAVSGQSLVNQPDEHGHDLTFSAAASAFMQFTPPAHPPNLAMLLSIVGKLRLGCTCGLSYRVDKFLCTNQPDALNSHLTGTVRLSRLWCSSIHPPNTHKCMPSPSILQAPKSLLEKDAHSHAHRHTWQP